jgi:hypothetical protein
MRRAAFAALIGAALLMAGCSSSSSSSSSPTNTGDPGTTAAAAPVTVRLDFLTNMTHASALVGLKEGFFAKLLKAGKMMGAAQVLAILAPNPARLPAGVRGRDDQADMPSTTAISIVILILGILVHTAFSMADRAIRRRWGLTGTV